MFLDLVNADLCLTELLLVKLCQMSMYRPK